MRGLWVVMLVVLAGQVAEARCVEPGDLARGVLFTREDGRTGRALAAGDGVKIDYDIRSDTWVDRRMVRGGVFETDRDTWRVDGPAVGEGVVERHRWFDPALPPGLNPGQSLEAAVREELVNNAPVANGPIRHQLDQTVRYRALDAQEVMLGGCRYRVIPVEAEWAGSEPAAEFQRWLYFADLGLGLETRSDEGRFGLTALWAE